MSMFGGTPWGESLACGRLAPPVAGTLQAGSFASGAVRMLEVRSAA